MEKDILGDEEAAGAAEVGTAGGGAAGATGATGAAGSGVAAGCGAAADSAEYPTNLAISSLFSTIIHTA